MILLDLIKNWRLRHSIPENQRNEKRWRFDRDGLTKIPLDDKKEVFDYNKARERQQEKETLES